MSSTEVVAALGPLTEMQRRFVLAYTDPHEPTFHNGTQAAIAAGASEKSARVTAARWIRDANIAHAIQARLERVQQVTDLDRGEYVLRVLGQADAWLDESGRPKVRRKRYFHEGAELACDEEELLPGMAQFKALELAGKLVGHVREESPLPAGAVFVIAMPVKAETAEQWFERYGRSLQAGREVGRV